MQTTQRDRRPITVSMHCTSLRSVVLHGLRPASWTPSAPVHVAKRALVAGDAIVRKLPRGYGPLADQLRRALLGAYLNLTEAAARDGNDRRQRFRCARAECNEAAAALEAAVALGLVPEADADAVLGDLDRLAAMLTRLGGFGR